MNERPKSNNFFYFSYTLGPKSNAEPTSYKHHSTSLLEIRAWHTLFTLAINDHEKSATIHLDQDYAFRHSREKLFVATVDQQITVVSIAESLMPKLPTLTDLYNAMNDALRE